jgi:small subunit ribosomal protein S16
VAVKLRLMRMGKKKQPTYRVVAADSRSPRNGRFIEIVGIYEPRQDPSVVRIDDAKALHWLRHGAQPTEQVRKLLEITGAWDRFTSGAEPLSPEPAADEPAADEAAPEAAGAEA